MSTSSPVGMIIRDRFELESVAGSGGMAMVFRARDHGTGRTVALKLMQPGSADPHGVQRFEREARILAELRHPGIVSYVAHGYTPSRQPFLAMEWLEGHDLAARLATTRLDPAESLLLVRCVADALATAHRAGIVHRDIKPSNLFLRDGRLERVTVLDFGVAHLAQRAHAMTRTGTVIGTPGYMAPEQARGDRELGPSADIFSLGCVLFECLTGGPPFTGTHVAALLAKILFEEPPRLHGVRPDLPAAVDELLARMLAKNPAQRPQDAAALVAELGALGASSYAVVPAAATMPAPLMAEAEQHYITVILATGPSLADVTLRPEEVEREREQHARLHDELSLHGCKVTSLADGSLVATLAHHGHRTASDQAVQGTRCALRIQECWPHSLVALVTSRGALRGAWPVGDALDRAGRLLAEPLASDADAGTAGLHHLRLDAVTAGLIEAHFTVSRVTTGSFVLQGDRQALDETRPLLGKPTPCVGREQELTMLEIMLAACIEESSARAVLITAQPGMGKSRLRHEFLRRTRGRHPEVEMLIGRGDPMSAGASYGLLGDALRRLCDVRDGAPAAISQVRLRERVGRHLEPGDAQRVTEFLGELCGVPFPDDDSVWLRTARQAPEAMGDGIRRSFLDFLRAECAVHPVLLVLEDLHWGDVLTVRLCDAALRELSDRPLLVLALARPEVKELFPRLWEGRERQEIELGGLKRRPCEQLIQGVLGQSVDAELVTRIIAQSAGNALYLEEIIRAVADGKSDELPETVVAMVQARLLRLDAGARRVLRAASVFGETFWSGGIAALTGASSVDTVERQLLELLDTELIERHEDNRLADETEYGFRHSLMRDAAYSLLTEEDRAVGHRLAGDYLERKGERDPMILAEHFARGGDEVRAGQYYVRATEQAHWTGDLAATIARAKRALECELPEQMSAAMLGVIAKEHGWNSGVRSSGPMARVLSSTASGSVAWATAMAPIIMACGLRGARDEVEALLDALCTVEPEPAALTRFSFAMMTGTYWSLIDGQCVAAGRLVTRHQELVAPVASAKPVAYGWLCLARAFHDEVSAEGPGSALRSGVLGRDTFQTINYNRGVVVAEIYIGRNLGLMGRHVEAERALRSTYVVGANYGPAGLDRMYYLVSVLLERGAVAEAEQVAQEFLAELERRDELARVGEGLARMGKAEALLMRGELPAAEDEARASCELLGTVRGHRLAAQATLASILLARGRAAEALQMAEEVLRLHAAWQYVGPRQARAFRVRAEALHQLGNLDGARTAMAAARDTLLARAQRIDDPELRQSFLHDLADHARILALADAWS